MKSRYFYLVILNLSVWILLAGCNTNSKTDTSADVQKIRQLTDFYTDAINHHLGDSLVKVYFGSEYYDLNQGNYPQNKEQMRQFFSNLPQRPKSNTQIVTDSIAVDGTLGTVRGHFIVTDQNPASDTIVIDNFNYVEVWHKMNDEWKVWWGMVSFASKKDSISAGISN